MGATFGPITEYMEAAEKTLEIQGHNKFWFTGQYRDLAIAATLLRKKEIIAVPTDTVYGLACLANDTEGIKRLYEIKGRDETKPLAMCVGRVEEVALYGTVTTELEPIIKYLLPGPYTIVLKRTDNVHKDLNPEHDSIGIRIPENWFIRNVVEIAGPIALTSANKSGKPSCITITEFSDLWPQLGGVFHNPYLRNKHGKRKGSTVIDLSSPGEYRIIRAGVGCPVAINYLNTSGLRNQTED